MKIAVKVVLTPVLRILDALDKQLKGRKNGARAGYLSSDTRKDGVKESKIALANEFGVPENNVPARPFLRNAREKIDKRLKAVVEAGLEDQIDMETLLSRCGVAMRNEIVESIDSNIPPENKESTIRRKGSSHTLIDTGQLRGAVHSAIITNGKEKLLPK